MIKYTKEDMQEIREIGYKQGVNDTLLSVICFIVGIALIWVVCAITS